VNDADRSANAAMLTTFAQKVAELSPDAWERVAAGCAALDQRTANAFLGRSELVGLSFVAGTDPYEGPFLRSAVGVWGTLWGLALEATHGLSPSGAARLEAAAPWLPPGAPLSKPLSDALSRLAAVACAQRPSHPGVAAALFAIGLAFIARRALTQASIAAIYKPFEREIPYASLMPGQEEHAA
jgi:hypothetical protein